MANSIFYEAGCRAALVKLGAAPHEQDPLYFLGDQKADLTPGFIAPVLGHGVLGTALGGLAGAGVSKLTGLPKDEAVVGGMGLGSMLGFHGKTIAGGVRMDKIQKQRAARESLLKDYIMNNAPEGVSPEDHRAALMASMAPYNEEIAGQKRKIEGWGW